MDPQTGLAIIAILATLWGVARTKPIERIKRILGVGISEGANAGAKFEATVTRPPFYKRWLRWLYD